MKTKNLIQNISGTKNPIKNISACGGSIFSLQD